MQNPQCGTISQGLHLTFESKFITVDSFYTRTGQKSILSRAEVQDQQFHGSATHELVTKSWVLDSILWCHCCVILNTFWTKEPVFLICTRSHKWCSQFYWHLFQLWAYPPLPLCLRHREASENLSVFGLLSEISEISLQIKRLWQKQSYHCVHGHRIWWPHQIPHH